MTRVTLREVAIAGLLTGIAAALRAWQFPDLQLGHFDEDVYAIGIAGSDSGLAELRNDTRWHLQAPPLYFLLIEAAYRMHGSASDLAAISVTLVFGVATVVLVWLIARRWFGPEAAAAAAALTALSNYHVAFSRVALTDVPFSFFYLLSLAAIQSAFDTGRARAVLAAGIATGAAWNTKYHGWLPLVPAVTTIAAAVVNKVQLKIPHRTVVIRWLFIALVAALCYVPFFLYIETHFGYASQLAYQRRFLSLNWPLNMWRQVTMQWYMDGWPARLAPAAAFMLAAVSARRRMDLGLCVCAAALAICGLAWGGFSTVVALVVLGLPMLLRQRAAGPWLAFLSVTVLLVLTGFYRPYARLFMPCVLSLYLVAGFTLGRLHLVRMPKPAPILAIALALISIATFGVPVTAQTWKPSTGERAAAESIGKLLPADAVVFVHGDAVLPFYLRVAGHRAFRLDGPPDAPAEARRMDTAGRNVFLVQTTYSGREPRSRTSFERLQPRLQLVGQFAWEPGDVRLLDDFSPSGARDYRLHPSGVYVLRLYRVVAPFLSK